MRQCKGFSTLAASFQQQERVMSSPIQYFSASVWPVSLAALLFSGAAMAQSAPSAESRVAKVGDKWTYEHKDHFDAAKTETRMQTVASVSADNIVFKTEGSKLGASEIHFSPDWLQHKRVLAGGVVRLYSPASPEFKFPMAVDTSWAADTSYGNPNGSKMDAKGEHKVVRAEAVELAGKRWDTLVIKTAGTFQISPGPYGRYESTRWYAPAARNVVKYEDAIFVGGRAVEKTSGELTAITLQD